MNRSHSGVVPGQVNDVYGEHEVRPGLEATVLPSPDEAPVPQSLCLGAKERGLGLEQCSRFKVEFIRVCRTSVNKRQPLAHTLQVVASGSKTTGLASGDTPYQPL